MVTTRRLAKHMHLNHDNIFTLEPDPPAYSTPSVQSLQLAMGLLSILKVRGGLMDIAATVVI